MPILQVRHSSTRTGFNKRITMRDIINNYPFPNTFQVLKLTGAGIKDALEKSKATSRLTIKMK